MGRGVFTFSDVGAGIESGAQGLYLDGLGPIGSYTQQVIAYICGEIRRAQGKPKRRKGKNRNKSRGRIFNPIFRARDTNSETFEELNGGGIGVVPVANEIGLVVNGNPAVIYELLNQGDKLNMYTRVYRLKIRHVLACLDDPTVKDILDLCSDSLLLNMDRETKIGDIEMLDDHRLLTDIDKETKLGDILSLVDDPLLKNLDESEKLYGIEGIQSHKLLQYIAYKTEIEDITSVHSHPQAIAQCMKKLIELLGCVDTETIDEHHEGPEVGEAMICTSLEWKQHYSQVEGNILMARRFQDDQRDTDEEGNKIQGYSIFTRQSSKIPVVPEAGKKGMVPDEYTGMIKKVIGTEQALEACKDHIPTLDTVKRIEEKSTTCHIEELKRRGAVLCSEEAAREKGLKILHRQFCPVDNYTYFIMAYKGKKQNIPGITGEGKDNMVHTIDPDDPLSNNNIEQKLKICIIDLVDPGSEERIKEILQAELRRGKIKLPFEKIEVFKGRKMFTGIMDVTSMTNSDFSELKKSINQESGDIKVLG